MNNTTPSTEPTTPPTSNPPTNLPSTTPPSNAPSTPPSSAPPPAPTPDVSTEPPEDPSSSVITSVITVTPPGGGAVSTSTLLVTSTQTPTRSSSSSNTRTATSSAGLVSGTSKSSGGGGLNSGGTIAVAVVVPIVAIAFLVAGALFFWRKRKQRKDEEEMRRKEVEEYAYNPNNDPSLPPAAGAAATNGGSDGQYEMREDGASAGYRGWGTTATGSTGRKTSTHLSGGQSVGTEGVGMAYSGEASPTNAAVSDRSADPLVDNRPLSGEQEALGAMGPATSNNQTAGVMRGVSNASSHYSAANRSDASGDQAGAYNGNIYTNELSGETPYGSPPNRAEVSGQPVIRDVQARRNTRIESPSHFPQQSAGISQNF